MSWNKCESVAIRARFAARLARGLRLRRGVAERRNVYNKYNTFGVKQAGAWQLVGALLGIKMRRGTNASWPSSGRGASRGVCIRGYGVGKRSTYKRDCSCGTE